MKRLLAASLLCWAALGDASAAGEQRYAVGERGFVLLQVPEGWVDRVRRAAGELPPTIGLRPASGEKFAVLITPGWAPQADAPKLTRDALRRRVAAAAGRVRTQAVEHELAVHSFGGTDGFGAYFSATDRAPLPGEYRFMTQGMLSLADLRVSFTILTNDGQESVVAQAISILKGMRREFGAGRGI
ncbi:MAG: hypothetical protein OEW21_06695 [Betaproteobacteria bacterium]|nr:hypothetical protein [Betaproteobacteria bacterium]